MYIQNRIFSLWNEYRDIPAIHAAGIISIFFCAAFLNYGWMLFVFAGFTLYAVSARPKKATFVWYVQCVSVEIAVLLCGLLFEVCFYSWMSALPTIHPLMRMVVWVLLASVLVSSKFFLISRLLDAAADASLFAKSINRPSTIFIALGLLLLSLGLFLFAQAGPDAMKMSSFFLRALVPGIL